MSVPSSDNVSVQAVRKPPSSAVHPWTTIASDNMRPRSGREYGGVLWRDSLQDWLLGVAFVALLGATGGAQVPPNATGWSASNYNESANRYSPLDQITAANVATLQPAWRFHLKPAGYTGPLKVDEAIPVVIGNTMYIASPYGAIHALDATTGVEKWKFQLPNHDVPSKRGLAYWQGGNGVQPQIILGGAP